MKKFFKALALVLALALVIGVVPAQATSAKVKAKKTLYAGENGATGESTDGSKVSGYKNRVAIYKLAGAKKADKEDHTFRAKIKSGDSVTVSKNYVYAADLGKSVVEIFKDGESLGTSVITVKKNATADTLTITGFEDGQEVVCGVEYNVTLPRKGVDSDERRLIVDDKAWDEVEGQARVYKVKFTKSGDHKVKFEAFQSAELDKATASKEITVKAVMPQPVSAKQVTASSFAVEFEGNMEGLITKDDIANDMIYYLIAKQPIVTGVVKDVAVEGSVVTVTMFSNFNSDTDYYFAYGSADAIKFHTAKNDIKYATSMKLIPEKAYYVGESTNITYKFYNADDVELDIKDQVASLSYDSDVAYIIGEKIYFYKEGTATIKASIITGYEEDSNTPIKLEDAITVTGVTKTATQTGKIYSFGATPDKKVDTIRVGAGAKNLQVEYTLSDNSKTTFVSDGASNTEGYILRSADERIAMVTGTAKNQVYGVSEGSTYIILCDKDGKDLDVFAITVKGSNRVSELTTVDLSKETLNLNDGLDDGLDKITLTIQGKDLDGNKSGGYTYSLEQATNNADAVKVTLVSGKKVSDAAVGTLGDGDGKIALDIDKSWFTDGRGTAVDGVAIVRLTVTVKAGTTTVVTKTVSFAVSNQNKNSADSWKLSADATALDASVKDWGTTNPADEVATISAEAVKIVNGYAFHINKVDFAVVSNQSKIPATGAANDVKNYVIASVINGSTVNYGAATVDTLATETNAIKVAAFASNTAQNKIGTYSFTGYHVQYAATATNGVFPGSRTPMGTVNVVVSKSDVQATAAIIDGTAETIKNVFGITVGDNNSALNVTGVAKADIAKVIVASWAGKNSKDDAAVNITEINYSSDKTTGAIYLDSVKVNVTLFGTYNFNQTVKVGQLFKDK